MAVPKRNHSNQRTAKRRANWKISAKGLINCPNCGSKVLPHVVCPSCGTYKKIQVLTPQEQ